MSAGTWATTGSGAPQLRGESSAPDRPDAISNRLNLVVASSGSCESPRAGRVLLAGDSRLLYDEVVRFAVRLTARSVRRA